LIFDQRPPKEERQRKGSRKQSTSHRKNENTRTANTSLRKTAKAKLELLARVLKLDMDNPSRPREIAPRSSRSCRREKSGKAKRRFPQSLTVISSPSEFSMQRKRERWLLRFARWALRECPTSKKALPVQ
jgi:hypothetical protein